MKEQPGMNNNHAIESAGSDFLGGALLLVKDSALWKQGLEIIEREGITDKVFFAHPTVFSRVLATERSISPPRHLDGKSTQTFYEVFLLDLLGLLTFERQRQMGLDRKNGIHYESSEVRSMGTLASTINLELMRARKIAGKLRMRTVPIITGKRSSGVVARITSQTEKITRSV